MTYATFELLTTAVEGPYRDAGGRVCLLVGDICYYLNPCTGELYRSVERMTTDKHGRVWRTPERRKAHNKRIHEQLTAFRLGATDHDLWRLCQEANIAHRGGNTWED